MKGHPFLIVGWKEWVSLPNLDIPVIKAKIDTGAATSSLHAHHIEYLDVDGITHVKYSLCPLQKNKKLVRTCIARLHDERMVKSSSGNIEKRPVIKTMLKIGLIAWEIELNLTNRDYMGMRMLIGREALDGRALVNAGHKFLQGTISAVRLKQWYN
jgi:ribosomal protein S6--L-glutamate ligase